MGFMGRLVGARFGGNNKVIIQQVERSDSSSADSESAAEGTTVSSGMTTAQVAKTVSPSVVVITTEQVVYSQWSWYGQSQVESGAGSGVIISSDGYILTCDHVVSGASNITVTIGDKDYPATVVGEDSTSDIAVIKIDADGLTPAIVGDSDKLAVGDNVLAVATRWVSWAAPSPAASSAPEPQCLHPEFQLCQHHVPHSDGCFCQPRQLRRRPVQHERRADRHRQRKVFQL